MSSQGKHNSPDSRVVDWLYDELSEEDRAQLDAELDGDDALRAEFEALAQTRAAFSDLEDEEPPAAVSAKLLHEAQRIQKAPGVFSWFAGLCRPLIAHPALAAVASLLLVAGVAGTLVVRNGFEVAENMESEVTSLPLPATETVAGGELERNGAAEQTLADKDVRSDGNVHPSDRRFDQPFNDAPPARLAARADEDALQAATGNSVTNDKRQRTNEKPAETQAKTSRRPASVVQAKGKATGKRKKNKPAKAADVVSSSNAAFSSSKKASLGGVRTEGKFAEPPPAAQATRESSRDQEAALEEKQDYNYRGRESVELEAAPTEIRKDKQRKFAQPTPTRWALTQQAALRVAVKQKACDDVARIANNISEREPEFYRQQVSGSKDVRPCRRAVTAELKRRSVKRRLERANEKAAGESGAVDAK